jgi:hypothetical protein
MIIGGVSGRYRGLRGRRQERAVPGAAIHWTSARPTAAGSPPIPGSEHPILTPPKDAQPANEVEWKRPRELHSGPARAGGGLTRRESLASSTANAGIVVPALAKVIASVRLWSRCPATSG